MLLYLFFDSLLSTRQKKTEIEKWPKAADSRLLQIKITTKRDHWSRRILTLRSSSARRASLSSLARPGATMRPLWVGGSSNAIPSKLGICVRYSQKWLMLLNDWRTTFIKHVLPKFLSPTTFFSLVNLELRLFAAGRLSPLVPSSEWSLFRVLGRRLRTTTSAFHKASASSSPLTFSRPGELDEPQLSSFSFCSPLRNVVWRIFSIWPFDVSFTTYSSQM